MVVTVVTQLAELAVDNWSKLVSISVCLSVDLVAAASTATSLLCTQIAHTLIYLGM